MTPSVSYERVSVVIPVLNSEKTIGAVVDETVHALERENLSPEIILVNDGSHDNSHEEALKAVARFPSSVKYLRLSKNFGEHNAVMCGLKHASGDCVVILDDDFQNPPAEIRKLLAKLKEGFDVVYGRYEVKHHAWPRNFVSIINGWFAAFLLGKPAGLYLSSFKIMNAFTVKAITAYEGPFSYVDGLILRSTDSIGQVVCEHATRKASHSNYTWWKLFLLWLNMFTGFSVAPLRLASLTGFVLSLTGLALSVLFIISKCTGGVFIINQIPTGWASLIVCVTFFSGFQLLVLGILGEYLGRLFLTVNRMPQFVIRDASGKGHERER